LYEGSVVQHISFSGQYSKGLEVYHEVGKANFIDCDLDIGGYNSAYIGKSMRDHLDFVVEKVMWGTFHNCG
jgi:acyl-CoA reductase-like NAD-dependent aldehyde dehydrogenase